MPLTKEQQRKKYRENKEYREHIRAQAKERYQKRKGNENFKLKRKQWRHTSQNRLKLQVLEVYGGSPPKCACCREEHIEFLTIDHINQYRREFGVYKGKGKLKYRSGTALYGYLKQNNYPLGYRVLCLNCNFAIGHFGYCPHGKKEYAEPR